MHDVRRGLLVRGGAIRLGAGRTARREALAHLADYLLAGRRAPEVEERSAEAPESKR